MCIGELISYNIIQKCFPKSCCSTWEIILGENRGDDRKKTCVTSGTKSFWPNFLDEKLDNLFMLTVNLSR